MNKEDILILTDLYPPVENCCTGEYMDHEAVLDNRASLDGTGVQDSSENEEEMVFALQDRHHRFSMGLSTVLQCLRMAEQEGGVPHLPSDWWIQVARRYPVILD
ncbi:hypothetical protein ACJU26_04125 [Acidithiobacillus sp. M4-SHS-6]|uniref:hypothetical protein n=1 Tax=Acidithiobacillus sp. M4-SHS-6 TaxID=3383024 RepID=UPI0039BE1C81